jgi:hypothetical protein
MLSVLTIFVLLQVDMFSKHLLTANIIPRVSSFLVRKSTPTDSCSVRVVTDIDDTVKSSGGVRLFGIALGGIDVSHLY